MRQSRSFSAVEASTNVILGWMIALITQALSGVFTAVSFLRSSVLRRLFTRLAC